MVFVMAALFAPAYLVHSIKMAELVRSHGLHMLRLRELQSRVNKPHNQSRKDHETLFDHSSGTFLGFVVVSSLLETAWQPCKL